MRIPHKKWIMLVLVSGLLMRLMLVFALGGDMYKGDGAEYRFYSYNLETYGVYTGEMGNPPRAGYDRMPGEPLLIFLTSRVVGYDSMLMLLPNVLAGWLMLVLVLRLVSMFHLHNRLSRIMVALYAVIPAVDYYAAQLYPEVPAACLVLFSFWHLGKCIQSPNGKDALLAGVFTGLAACFRPESAFNLLIIAGAVFFSSAKGTITNRMKMAIAPIIGFFLLLSPWIVRNFVNENRFIPLGDNFLIEQQDSLAADERGCSRGLYLWINTWHYREKHVKQVAWDFMHADLSQLPESAFRSPSEMAAIEALQKKPYYDCGSDRLLMSIANERKAEVPLRHYMVLPAQRIFFLLFRVERFDSLGAEKLPQSLVTVLWVGFSAFGNFLSLFALLGVIWVRSLPPLLRWMLAAAWLRLLFFAVFYHVEVRYMLLFAPEFFLIALFLLSKWTLSQNPPVEAGNS
jgi:Dolichyl-phosphate-mannose-protein mannosyltransferase